MRQPCAGFVVAVVLAQSGCLDSAGIAPQQARLDANALSPGAALAQARREAGWPQEDWWRQYRDPQLDAWIARALEHSPRLDEAEARVSQAMALAGETRATEAPQLAGGAGLQRQHWPDDALHGPGALAGSSHWNGEAGLGLRYALDLWGRERDASESARHAAYARAAEGRVVQLELQRNIVRVYVQLALRHAERDILKATLAQQEQILALARRRLAGGLGTAFEVSQASAPLPETRRQIAALNARIALAGHQLAALAGQGPGAAAALQRPKLRLAAQPSLPAVLPADLLGRRPDVVARRWQVAAQADAVDVARADFYPNVDLVARLGFGAVGGGALALLRADKLGGSIGPALSLPLFDGGRRRERLGAASADYDAAVARYNQTLTSALREIADQLIRLRSLEAQQRLAAEALTTAEASWRLAERAWRGGLTDYLAVLEAQARLFERQRVQQRVWAARLVAHTELTVALGGGLLDARHSPAEPLLAPRRVPLAAAGAAPR